MLTHLLKVLNIILVLPSTHSTIESESCQFFAGILSNSAKKKHVSLHFKTFVICQHCGRNFKQEKLFAAHYFVHVTKRSEVGQHKCEICSKRFTTNLHLQTHVLVHFPYGEHCPYCDKHFNTGVELHYHLKMHAKRARFQCIICAKKCATMQLLENHLRVHLRKHKPFLCDICCSDLGTRFRLKRHLMFHAPKSEGPYRCEICFRSFAKRSLLVYHSKLHKKNFQCKICFEILSSTKYLDIHLRRHTGENRFECEVCSKKFGAKHNLEAHQTIHYRKNTYRCNICSKVLITEEGFKVHLQNHRVLKANPSNPRLFTCHLCPKGVDTYKSPSAYTKHMDKHNIATSVEIKCEICSIRFKRQEVYDKHLEVNRVDKPFYCKKCSEYFTLKCHDLIHCKKQPAIKCIYCQQVFNCRSSLARHSIEHERAFQEAKN